MKRNPKKHNWELRQITNGRETEHQGSKWDSKVIGNTELSLEELRYKAWEPASKGKRKPSDVAKQYL